MSKFMSKFFGQGNASSDQDNDHQNQSEENKKGQPHYQMFDEDRDDDKKRVILTEKEKKWTEFKKIISVINTALNNKDFDKVWEKFQQLLKSIQTSQKLLDKQGFPSFLVKFLIKVDEQVTNLDNEQKKKLNKNSKVAYNTMKQKLKNKIMPDFKQAITKFQQQGQNQEQSDQEFKKQQSSSSESEDNERDLLRSEDPMERRKYWLKKQAPEKIQTKPAKQEKPIDQEKPPNEPKPQEQRPKKKAKIQVQKKQKVIIENVNLQRAQAQIKKMIKDFYKLKSQQERQEYLHILNGIKDSSKTQKYEDFQKLSIRLVDIPMRIQVSRQMRLTHFIRQHWLDMFTQIEQCFQLLRQTEDQDILDHILQFSETQSAQKIVTTEQTIYNQLKAFIIILQTQIKKAFMFIENSDLQYSQRLQDLIKLVEFMYKLGRQMNRVQGLQRSASQLSFKVIQNMHFMSSDFLNNIKIKMGKGITFTDLKNQQNIEAFVNQIMPYESSQNVTKLILYLVFNHAINYRPKAKDVLNMSNIPHIINKCDYYTQVLYNRAIVSIGICSFRNGNLFEVQQFLSQICGYAKIKEQPKFILRQFLAQGSRVSGQQLPKNKLLPYYLHLNCQMIQCLELIASMILQVPYMLNEGGRITSKTFRKLISDYQRSYFVAQPIKSKDLIYAASNCLKTAKWKQCFERLMELSFWKQINDFDTVKANLLSNIKQQSLKCYLVGNRKCFTSISLDGLSTKFELPIHTIRKLVCKWIYNKVLKGSITSEGYLQSVQKKQSDMQKVSEQFFNKLQDVMKLNENIFENRLGAYNDEDDQRQAKFQRRTNAMTEKLKATLSKRA